MPDRIHKLPALLIAAFAGLALQRCAPLPAAASSAQTIPAGFTLSGEQILRVPPDAAGLRFGGLSGIVSVRDGHELLAISDDHESARVVRLRVTGGAAWNVEPTGLIRLEAGGAAPGGLDAEGIALSAEGHILVSSEGLITADGRFPPSITEYSPDGRYIRQLPIRPRYVQNPEGPLVTGVRTNAGLESLTTTPDFSRLFTATELSLLQDGDGDPFSTAARTRLLEYRQQAGGYEPAREYAYELDPLPRPTFAVGFAVNGLVELLALNNSELLAMERAFIESADKSTTINRIRLFRISLDQASDISALDRLGDAPEASPVKKVLLADLAGLPGLSPRLAHLDNFEGLAWGPLDSHGIRPVILVSDDNFNPSQVTAFLFLQPDRPLDRNSIKSRQPR